MNTAKYVAGLPRSYKHFVWNIRPDQILPNGEANLPGAKLICDAGDGAHLRNA